MWNVQTVTEPLQNKSWVDDLLDFKWANKSGCQLPGVNLEPKIPGWEAHLLANPVGRSLGRSAIGGRCARIRVVQARVQVPNKRRLERRGRRLDSSGQGIEEAGNHRCIGMVRSLLGVVVVLYPRQQL